MADALKPEMKIKTIKNSGSPGFSLVEVVLALAVLASGIILILGLFPTSLQAGRKATDQTMAAMIAQDELNDYRLRINMSTSALAMCSTLGGGARCYTVDGQGTASYACSATNGSFYEATTVITDAIAGGGCSTTTTTVERITVTIAWPYVAPSGNRKTLVYFTQVAKPSF